MSHLSPEGPVYQAGTLSGNPIAMQAGLTTLEHLERKDFYEELNKKSMKLMTEIKAIAKKNRLPFEFTHAGGMFGFSFSENGPIKNFDDIVNTNTELFKKFFHAMLVEDIYFAPSAYEAGFMSSEHSEDEIDITITAAEKVFKNIKN
jgi:glutamate-1-semialdehyde 2,1-aminomutase